MGLFSFGSSKTKSKSTFDESQTTEQQQSGSQQQSTTSQQQATGSSSTTGSQATSGTTQEASRGTTRQQSTQRGQAFTDTTLSALDQFLQSQIGGAGASQNAAVEAVQNAQTALGTFDPDAFVSNLVTSASDRLQQQATERNNAFASAIGGSAENNSIANLVANRGAAENAATLAGIEGQASGQAAGIFSQLLQNVLQGSQAAGIPAIAQLANALRGGVTETTGEQQAETATDVQQQQESATQSQEQTQQQQQVSTQELLNNFFTQLGIATQEREGTSTSKGKKSGFGFSFDPISLLTGGGG